jgi:uracil-DNA glycosylase
MSALELFKSVLVAPKDEQVPRITKLRGNLNSKILLVTPPLTKEEYSRDTPFCSPAARIFHELLKQSSGLDTNKDFLVVPCSIFGLKPNKASTDPIVKFVTELRKRNAIQLFLPVGEEAMKHVFNGGKKANLVALVGNVVRPPQIGYLQLLALPDVDPLIPEKTENNRENYIRERKAEQRAELFCKLAVLIRHTISKL